MRAVSAWTNGDFIAEDGPLNEVDLLAVTPSGLFFVEIKSWPGTLFGDGQRWRLKRPNGRETMLDHLLLLADLKAKRLRSLLARQGAQPPWVTPLVFLSSPALDVRLHDIGRTAVTGRDPDPSPTAAPQGAWKPLPGVVATLKSPRVASQRGYQVNKPTSAKVAAAVDQAGLKPANRGRLADD